MRIRTKIGILSLVPSIVVGSIASWMYFYNARQDLEKEIFAKLEAVARLKADSFETFFAERRADVLTAKSFHNIRVNLPVLEQYRKDPANAAYLKSKEMLDNQLGAFQQAHQYVDVMLFDGSGRAVYSSDPAHASCESGCPWHVLNKEALEKAKAEIYVGNIVKTKDNDHPYTVLMAAPIHDLQDRFIGFIGLEIDMGVVYELVQDKTGMGESGETILVKKISEDKAVFLSPLLYDPDALLKKEIILKSDVALPAQKAVTGESGCGLKSDYRGVSVLSCWDYIPLVGWGMVAKVDETEAFAPIAQLQKIVIAIFVVGVSSILLVVLFASKVITGSIRKLRAGTEIIGNGNWNYKVGQAGKDEISELSRAFDSMMERLKETAASRDELNRLVEFNATLLKTIPFGMDIVDEQGNILFINDKLKAIAGGVTEGKKCWELYRDDKERCSDCPLIKGIQLGETATIEARGCFGGRTLQISHTGMMYEGRRAVLEIFQDITERRMAEEEAQKAVNVKNEFISVVSHELRAPLAPIKESASLMLEGLTGEINDQQKKFLGTIKRNSERLNRLINDVLDFQKLESGMVKLIPSQNSMNDVIREVYQTMVIVSKEKGLGFDLELAKDIPPISFDRDKIIQVLTNLVSNAIKFTEATGHIKITAAQENSSVHVAVTDTGFGIKKEDIPKLFQSFHQLDTTREKKLGGTGLGLAISKEIILRHKGRIWAESELGKGAAFHFVLPMDEHTG